MTLRSSHSHKNVPNGRSHAHHHASLDDYYSPPPSKMGKSKIESKRHDWARTLNMKEIKKDFKALGKELMKSQGEEDMKHLRRVVLATDVASILGLCLSVCSPMYVVPWVLISTVIFARFAIVNHHVSHGGFDNCCGSLKYKRFTFAKGSVLKRLADWPDHILPSAWDFEHNHLHHHYLNEDIDPDLVERNLFTLRNADLPFPVKYLAVAFFVFTWRWSYYASNTFANLIEKKKVSNSKSSQTVTVIHLFMGKIFPSWNLRKIPLGSFIFREPLPYLAYQFVFLPFLLVIAYVLLIAPSSWILVRNIFANLILADLLSNAHSFVTIVTNHAGNDMYRWRTRCAPMSGAFYVRAIVSSANFNAGNDLIDFLHGYLNYQAEHHCFPRLSMLSYQKAMPRVKALAKKHGIPYVQESVWIRLKKTIDIMVGRESMIYLPLELENRMNDVSD